MPSVIIIGSGPAGISASLYCVRAGLATTVISNGKSVLASTDKIENYYGFPNGISGTQLEKNGVAQAKALGVKLVNDEVFSISYQGDFVVSAKNGDYNADGIIIATGSKRNVPKIKGIKDFEGKGISFCAVCDAFFFRDKEVAVLGNSDYALHEVHDLLPVVKSVTLLTNGEELKADFPPQVNIISDKISEFTGSTLLDTVHFENGSTLNVNGVFIAYGTADSTALAKKVGAATDGSRIKTDENMKTSVAGLYAAGDCTGGLLQISKAVYDGAKAATELIKYLRKG